MKIKNTFLLMSIPLTLLALSAQAHDPKEHMKDKQKPDCAAMKTMDHSKMDMKDPVVQAMMKQCMNKDHHQEGEAVDSHGDSNDAHEHKKSSDDNDSHKNSLEDADTNEVEDSDDDEAHH